MTSRSRSVMDPSYNPRNKALPFTTAWRSPSLVELSGAPFQVYMIATLAAVQSPPSGVSRHTPLAVVDGRATTMALVCGRFTTSRDCLTTSILSFEADEGTMREFAEAVTTLLAAAPTVWTRGRSCFISIPISKVPSRRAMDSKVESRFSQIVVILSAIADVVMVAASCPNLKGED